MHRLPPLLDPIPYRQLFPVSSERVYLNHAGVGPTSTRTLDRVARWVARLASEGLLDSDVWEAEVDACRERTAQLIGGRSDEIAFVRNTSHGLSLIAEGIDWQPGDRILVADDLEYPSNVYPWLRLQREGRVQLDRLPHTDGAFDLDRCADVIGEQTRLVAVSAAQFGTGAVTDLIALGELCRQHDALLCVDLIQTCGALPVDLRQAGVHFATADSHKWMMGLPGIGFLWVAHELTAGLRPALVGWKSTTDGWNFDRTHLELLGDARRFEEGTAAYPLIAGFDAAVSLLNDVGVDRIAATIQSLVEPLARDLERLGLRVGPAPEHRRHIVTFDLGEDETTRLRSIHSELERRGYALSLRRGRIRVSPHFYNTSDELLALIDTLQRLLHGSAN